MNKDKYIVVKSAIENDMNDIKKLTEELAVIGLYPEIKVDKIGGFDRDSSYACRLIGSFLSDYYEGIENIAKRIAKEIDGYYPAGDQWHKELIEQMARELPGKRPAVFSENTLEGVDELRRFRHVFRAKYGFRLNPKKVYENVSLLRGINTNINADINSFITKMDALLEHN